MSLSAPDGAWIGGAILALVPEPSPVNWMGIVAATIGLVLKLAEMHRAGCEQRLAEMSKRFSAQAEQLRSQGDQLADVKHQLDEVLAVVKRFRAETDGIAGPK